MNVQILALCNEQRQNNGLEKLMTREGSVGAGGTGTCRGDCELFSHTHARMGQAAFHSMMRQGWITVLLEKILRQDITEHLLWWMAG